MRKIAVFRPDQLPVNLLEAAGSPMVYWSRWFFELGRAFNLRPETSMELVSIMERIAKGMRPGDPAISCKDLERILRSPKTSLRKKFATAGYALAALNAVLGQAAFIRKAPPLESRYQIMVLEMQGLPPRIHSFLSAIYLLRTQMAATAQGHATRLRLAYISDEAMMEMGREFTSATASGYMSPYKQQITQVRSLGMAVLAGVQMLSEIDDSIKSNVGTLVCFRCPNPKDAREALSMLGMNE